MIRFLSCASLLVLVAICSAADWPAWRGPDGTGQCHETGFPLTWNRNKNVSWHVPLPGPGNSSPIVVGDRVFITQAIDVDMRKKLAPRRAVLCFDRHTGKLTWQREIRYDKKEGTHRTNFYCSASPVSDGEIVVAWHGSAGVVAYDMQGNPLWHRDLGRCEHIWGNAASPVMYRHLVIVNFGPGERTFLIALNKKTGKTEWKVDIPGGKDGYAGQSEWIGSWSTPVIARIGGKDVLVMSWPGEVRGHDPRTGEVLWICRGLAKDNAPDRLVYTSPLVTPNVVVAMAGFRGPALAVRPEGTGDITESQRLWRHRRANQRIGSGVIVGPYVFAHDEGGVLSCIEWKTGRIRQRRRVTRHRVWGSIVHADSRLYLTDSEGETVVVSATPELEVLARNPLEEHTESSPAFSDGHIFIRTHAGLWCIGSRP